jgi:hypothetical protein
MDTTFHPDAVLSARADDRLAHAYEQIARADEQLARVTAKLSRIEADTTHRPTAGHIPQRSSGSTGARVLIALAVATCIGGAAFASRSSGGEAARGVMAPWLQSYMSPSWMSVSKPSALAQQGASPIRLAAVGTDLLQAVPVVQDVAASPGAIPAPSSGEVMQTLQTMAHDIATMQQGIEQLKANQAQIAADNARAIEQIRANQDQLRQAFASAEPPPAKPAAQLPRARPPAPPPGAPRPIAAAAAAKPLPAPPARPRPRAQPFPSQQPQ